MNELHAIRHTHRPLPMCHVPSADDDDDGGDDGGGGGGCDDVRWRRKFAFIQSLMNGRS